jgi:hypothetical protein
VNRISLTALRFYFFAATSRYPDGSRWKNAIRRNWANAFNVVTKQQQRVAAVERTFQTSWKSEQDSEIGNASTNMVTNHIKATSSSIQTLPFDIAMKQRREQNTNRKVFHNIITTQRRNPATITESNKAERNSNSPVVQLAGTTSTALNDETTDSIAHEIFRHAGAKTAHNIF